MISLQQIFDAAWEEFIVKDNPPAVEYDEDTESYECRYLTKDGRKCAVGLCLPDGLDTKCKTMNDELTLVGLIDKYPELFMFADFQAFGFQGELHDNYVNKQTGKWKYSKEKRKEEYVRIAKKYGLEIPEGN